MTDVIDILYNYCAQVVSIVLWSRMFNKIYLSKLDQVQGIFLRGITTTKKNTPCAALRAKLGVPTLALHIKIEAFTDCIALVDVFVPLAIKNV